MRIAPVCCKCNKEFRCEKNGVEAIEQADFGDYKYFRTDKYKCPTCGIEVLVGFGEPLIHHENGFKGMVERAKQNEHYTF